MIYLYIDISLAHTWENIKRSQAAVNGQLAALNFVPVNAYGCVLNGLRSCRAIFRFAECPFKLYGLVQGCNFASKFFVRTRP